MRFLRTNTAVIVTVGPFFDKTDGVTLETALTITNERITLTADTDAGSAPTNILDNVTGATSGTANDLNYITGNDAGLMQLELSAANVNRLGRMFLTITDAANHCPVFHEFMVLPEMIYDSLILGTDRFDTNVTHIADTAQTARDVGASVLLSSGTGTGQLDFTSGVVKANLAQILGTALTETAGLIAAGFKQFFNIVSPTSTMNTITTVTTATNLTNAPTNGDLTATMKTSVTTAATAATPTAAAVTGAVGSVTGNVGGNVTGSVGSLAVQAKADVNAEVDTAISDAALATAAAVADLPTNAELATALGTADDAVLAAIAALNNLSAAEVNAEVVDALATDTYAEPGQGAPGSTTTLAVKIGYLYKAWRNRTTQTATEYALYNDDAVTKGQEAIVSDDATTFERGEVGTGA